MAGLFPPLDLLPLSICFSYYIIPATFLVPFRTFTLLQRLLEPGCPSEHTGLYGLDNRGIGGSILSKGIHIFLYRVYDPPPSQPRVKQTTHRNLVPKIKIVELYLHFPTSLQDFRLKLRYIYCFISRDSSFGIVTRLRAGRPTNRCSIASSVKTGRPALGLAKPRKQWAPVGLSPGLRRHRRESQQLSASSSEVKNGQL